MADSKKIDDGGPAFQTFRQHALGSVVEVNAGMSLRDWFAGKFLAGVAGSPESAAPLEADPADQSDVDRALREHWDFAARAAYIAADAMIAARKGCAHLRSAAPEVLEALRPFAEVYKHDIGADESDADLFQVINHNRAPKLTVGDFRRAFEELMIAEGRS